MARPEFDDSEPSQDAHIGMEPESSLDTAYFGDTGANGDTLSLVQKSDETFTTRQESNNESS